MREKIIQLFSKERRWETVFFLIVASIYIMASGILIWQYPMLYNSPDETANAFFSRLFATTGQFRFHYPINAEVSGIVHPRSLFVLGEDLIPGSFLGLPVIYGTLGFVFGLSVMPWLTIVFTLFASVALYRLIRLQWSQHVAVLSASLFLLHPAIVYYSARGFMHNVLFVDLLLISLFFLFCLKQKWWTVLVSGIFLSLCLAVRTSEIFWVGGCGVLVLVFFWRYCTWSRIAFFLCGVVIGFFPFLQIQHALFGRYCLSPYTCLRSVNQISASAQQQGTIQVTTVHNQEKPPEISVWHQDLSVYLGPLKVLFPFGVVFSSMARSVFYYLIWIFAGLSLFSVIGYVFLVKKRSWFYVCIVTFVTIWLAVYYGSWKFVDNINQDPITLGNSFVRYFLPSYVVFIPCIVLGIGKVVSRRWMVYALCTGMLVWSICFVWWPWPESLAQVQETLVVNQQQKEFWQQYIPEDGVVITERQDKVFFPDRQVISDGVVQPEFVSSLNILNQQYPVFYHTMLKPVDIAYIESRRLKETGVHFTLVDGPYHGYYLYQLEK